MCCSRFSSPSDGVGLMCSDSVLPHPDRGGTMCAGIRFHSPPNRGGTVCGAGEIRSPIRQDRLDVDVIPPSWVRVDHFMVNDPYRIVWCIPFRDVKMHSCRDETLIVCVPRKVSVIAYIDDSILDHVCSPFLMCCCHGVWLSFPVLLLFTDPAGASQQPERYLFA